MARPNKTGLLYYNIDTDRYSDIRIRRLKNTLGCTGIAVYDYILCAIYYNGGVLQWGENTVLDVAEYFALKETTIMEVINYCCNVGLFNKELFANESVLTSKSIQERYIFICKNARIKYEIDERFNLTSSEEIIKSTEDLLKSTEDSSKSSAKSTQIKRKKSKVNTKEKEVHEEKEKTPKEQEYDRFNAWIDKTIPYLRKIRDQITFDEYLRLTERYNGEQIRKILTDMANYKDAPKKYVSVNLTFQKWAKKEYGG